MPDAQQDDAKMLIHVLFAQRKEAYEGEYAPEALAVMTDNDHSCNPEYLHTEKEKADESQEFENTVILGISVSDAAVMQALRPDERPAVPGEVTGALPPLDPKET